MQIDRILFEQFRNIERQTLTLSDGINVLCGDNAQGKTNALEGIFLFAQGRSFRTAKEREYIMEQKDYARLTADYHAQGRSQSAQMAFRKNGRKTVSRNRVPIRKMSEFIGSFRAVVFCPDHLSLVKDGPAMRRKFLDGAISQLDPIYLRAVQTYSALVARRNRLLLQYPGQQKTLFDTLDLLDAQMAAAGEKISEARAEYTEQVGQSAKRFFADMTGGAEQPEFVYRRPRTAKQLAVLFREHREKDLRSGTTNAGVHKDDIAITLNGYDARAYASQGQQRSLAIAIKLAETEISRKSTGERPVLLLDDVLSELDETRKNYILTGLLGGQIVLTACEPELVSKLSGNLIHVHSGTFA